MKIKRLSSLKNIPQFILNVNILNFESIVKLSLQIKESMEVLRGIVS